MARPLKVYRTVAGFYDAYVAAPSKKAALAAWGSDKDLFARGDAELIEDADLMAAPLADPGTVIRRSRGTTAAQIAAMPDRQRDYSAQNTNDHVKPSMHPSKGKSSKSSRPSKSPNTPKPSKRRLIAAEKAWDTLRETQQTELRALEKREAMLARERQIFELRRQASEEDGQRELQEAKAEYDTALKRWQS